MILRDTGGSLGPLIWLFICCIFYLLPVIFLGKYIGGWAWPAGIAFWLLVAGVIGYTVRFNNRKKDDNDRQGS